MIALEKRFDALDRLATRVLGGGVVFFIGAGFSRDSEGNSAERLIGRLLARLLALCTVLDEEKLPKSQARVLLVGLGTVFKLSATPKKDERLEPARCMTAENVGRLAREYYNFNEWCASAFGVLTAEVNGLEDESRRRNLIVRAHCIENFLLTRLSSDSVALAPPEWPALERIGRAPARGKTLFLDTMGFADAEVMGGDPSAPSIEAVSSSYANKLRPRHHALARLAREGLIPVLVTTNFDLLLDGAYRLAGFRERGAEYDGVDVLPETAIPSYARIVGAESFFACGEGHRTALLLKIHGCAEAYRRVRAEAMRSEDPRCLERLEAYLPALVFTYREIQTWRADAWSRDLVRTLLRTHTLAFVGYSGSDPVLHSTFREVYEEMARLPHRAAALEPEPSNAPVFFFEVAGKREFHSFEIFRAANEAAGLRDTELLEHPNHVEFETSGDFPGIDDEFRWLAHHALRKLQTQFLRTRLRRLSLRLRQHPCADAEYETLCASFEALCGWERKKVASATAGPGTFDAVVGWTWFSLPAFLRELALGELIQNRRGPDRTVRLTPWYYPATANPDWTAWAAILELALRRLVATWRGGSSKRALTDFEGDAEWLAAEDCPQPVVSFASGEDERQPSALCVRLSGFDRAGRRPALKGAFRRVRIWELLEEDVPWPVVRRRAPLAPFDEPACPAANEIWRWALGTGGELNAARAARILGVLPRPWKSVVGV